MLDVKEPRALKTTGDRIDRQSDAAVRLGSGGLAFFVVGFAACWGSLSLVHGSWHLAQSPSSSTSGHPQFGQTGLLLSGLGIAASIGLFALTQSETI